MIEKSWKSRGWWCTHNSCTFQGEAVRWEFKASLGYCCIAFLGDEKRMIISLTQATDERQAMIPSPSWVKQCASGIYSQEMDRWHWLTGKQLCYRNVPSSMCANTPKSSYVEAPSVALYLLYNLHATLMPCLGAGLHAAWEFPLERMGVWA